MLEMMIEVAAPKFLRLKRLSPRAFDLCFSRDIGWHKQFEVQLSNYRVSNLLSIDFRLQFRGRDHAGPKLELELLGYIFSVQVYDQRHWDHDKGRWMSQEDWERSLRSDEMIEGEEIGEEVEPAPV